MMESESTELDAVLEKINFSAQKIPGICMKGVVGAGTNQYPSDLFVLAVASRTMALCSAYVDLVNARNYYTAAALVRLQLDSAMRLFGSTLVPDMQVYCKQVIDGKQINQIKDRDGTLLTDGHLVRKLSKLSPRMMQVYKSTSGFVHLSGAHIFGLVSETDDEAGTVSMFIGASVPAVTNDNWIEASAAFLHVTEIISGLMQRYGELMVRFRT